MYTSKDFDVAIVELLPGNIAKVLIKSDQEVKLEHVVSMLDWFREMGFSKLKTIIVPEIGSTMDPEIREHMTSELRAGIVIADAIVITNFAHQLVANFYLRFHKPKILTKVFSSEKEGMEWLNAITV